MYVYANLLQIYCSTHVYHINSICVFTLDVYPLQMRITCRLHTSVSTQTIAYLLQIASVNSLWQNAKLVDMWHDSFVRAFECILRLFNDGMPRWCDTTHSWLVDMTGWCVAWLLCKCTECATVTVYSCTPCLSEFTEAKRKTITNLLLYTCISYPLYMCIHSRRVSTPNAYYV